MNLLNSNKVKKLNENMTLYIDGKLENLPVYEIELDALYYNDKNDRVLTWSSSCSHEELLNLKKENIEEYNKLFEEWIKQSNISKINNTKENIKTMGQLKAAVVLNDGRIIDGNRRFTCLRMLQRDNKEIPNKYKLKAVILDLNINSDDKRIKILELNIQLGEDEKVSYSPIEIMLGAYNDIILNKLITIDEYSEAANISKVEVKRRIENAEFLCELLNFINAPGKYYIARDNAWHDPILESVKTLKLARTIGYSEDEIESLKKILFLHLITNQSGDKTRYMRQFSEIVKNKNNTIKLVDEQFIYLDKVLDILDKNLNKEKKLNNPENFFSDIANEDFHTQLNEALKSTVEINSFKDETNKPLKILKNLSKNINYIDSKTFKYCSKEIINDTYSELNSLHEKINELRKEIEKYLN